MGRARRLHASAAVVGLAVALVMALAAAGCGSLDSSSGTKTGGSTNTSPVTSQAPKGATTHGCTLLTRGVSEARATGVACTTAVEVVDAWAAEDGCRMTARASRGACAVGRYRCLATSTGRGIAVSCSRPGRTISFLARRG